MKSTTFNAAILFIFTCLFAHISFGQNTFFVGPMATGHLSNQEVSKDFADFNFIATDGYDLFNFRQDMDTKSLLGLSGGVSFGFQFGRFSILSGARFYQKGARQESREFELLEKTNLSGVRYYDYYEYYDLGTFKLTERQNFIHIPLLARYQFLGDDFGVTLALGPAFNIGIGKATTDWNFEGGLNGRTDEDSNEETFGKDLVDLYKPVQTSFVISPGIVLPIGNQGKLHFTVYWENALSSSINDSYINRINIGNETFLSTPDGDKRNNSFGFGISYEHHLDLNIGSKY